LGVILRIQHSSQVGYLSLDDAKSWAEVNSW